MGRGRKGARGWVPRVDEVVIRLPRWVEQRICRHLFGVPAGGGSSPEGPIGHPAKNISKEGTTARRRPSLLFGRRNDHPAKSVNIYVIRGYYPETKRPPSLLPPTQTYAPCFLSDEIRICLPAGVSGNDPIVEQVATGFSRSRILCSNHRTEGGLR